MAAIWHCASASPASRRFSPLENALCQIGNGRFALAGRGPGQSQEQPGLRIGRGPLQNRTRRFVIPTMKGRDSIRDRVSLTAEQGRNE